MCTSIVEISDCDGMGKGDAGEWFKLTHSVVSYDHPHHALLEEAITIDFVNRALELCSRREYIERVALTALEKSCRSVEPRCGLARRRSPSSGLPESP